MISRSAIAIHFRPCLQRQCQGKLLGRRGLAAPASGSFTYEVDTNNGIKFASRDLPGPTTTVAVVARAGTRYQALPGFADGLENFAFKVSSDLDMRTFLTLRSGNAKTIFITNHTRSRATRWSAQRVSLEGELGPSSQVSQGRPGILCGAARRDRFADQVYRYLLLDRSDSV